ncbi:uncharacterized protein LOC143544908 [Bidens hawaiensis]|uniref:uncharacterized protein LOC143544908 n=1 Tax=Bidens hawaiensis TaxID=980011 RepID=UPI00404B464D
MAASLLKKMLTLYLFALDRAVSTVLMVDSDKVQTRIYYVSSTLSNAETRGSTLEKPLYNVLCKPELLGRLAKWAIELGEHAIEYKPRPTIKGQVLANFIVEVSVAREEDYHRELESPTAQDTDDLWRLYTHEASNVEGVGIGLRLIDPEGHEFTCALSLRARTTRQNMKYSWMA